jgi:hypothetical protein
MMRRFQFEAEVYDSLSCVPMGVRRKLDHLGLKISLEQWQRLSRGERLMICHAPAQSSEESDALRLFIEEATVQRCGSRPQELSHEARLGATPPAAMPARLKDNAEAAGVTLTQADWDRLDDDQRYALVKLGGGAEQSHNFRAALAELLTAHAAPHRPGQQG